MLFGELEAWHSDSRFTVLVFRVSINQQSLPSQGMGHAQPGQTTSGLCLMHYGNTSTKAHSLWSANHYCEQAHPFFVKRGDDTPGLCNNKFLSSVQILPRHGQVSS